MKQKFVLFLQYTNQLVVPSDDELLEGSDAGLSLGTPGYALPITIVLLIVLIYFSHRFLKWHEKKFPGE